MNVHIRYKMAKAPDVEREFAHHISKLGKRLQVYRPELVHLHGIVDQGSSKGGMMVSLNLRLPSGQLAAQEDAPTAVSAAKRAFAELTKQLTKHKDLLRTARDRRARSPAFRTALPLVGIFERVRARPASAARVQQPAPSRGTRDHRRGDWRHRL